MKEQYDVVIVGGAVIGSSIAYFLAANPDFDGSILVVERDPTYVTAATSLSSSAIRNQFSNPINVKISQFGTEFIKQFAQTMKVGDDEPDLHFHEGGYLFLASTPDQVQTLKENHDVQRACGADVVLWNRDELAEAFPHLRVEDIELASYGRSGEGWFNNTGMMQGFKAKARALGADYVKDQVVGIEREGDLITGVRLESGGTVRAGTVINASGTRASLTARMAGLDIPVEPRKRTLFVFDCAQTPEGTARVNQGRLPLMIDPSGVFCRPEGRYFLSGCPPIEDPAVDWDDFDPRYDEFEEVIWPTLAERSEAFEAIKVINQWAGHYDFNTLDHNLVVGRHPQVRNFIFASGFSGHGLQQAPATGRAVSELITYGSYRTLDLSEVGYERILENRPFLEKAVI
ncbi:NAD(P)/FAD-dependent oxidoreductase [Halomonas sp. NCCP-2165]|nr:FAD-binding oxidoreductase [Halomonas sp. NCCP-2165]GKW48745.1 FAD-dependent oxidoreductase [Halomonas sp. NCCP-2165]